MGLAENLKTARESIGKSQKDMAKAAGVSVTAWQNYESGGQIPGGKVFEALAKMGFNTNWLLTGEGTMKPKESSQYAAGNGFVQSHHIAAEEIHVDIHQGLQVKDKSEDYLNSLDEAFIMDWWKLSDVGKMRVWTMLKEEIQRERETK